MIYLGTLGRMVGIKCPSSQNVEFEDKYSFETTLEGKRKAQRRLLGRRSWSLQVSDATTPADQATILGFVNGEWGNGPFAFVSADAPQTNLLTPLASASLTMRSDATPGGPANLGSDGWAGSSISAPSGVTELYLGVDDTPVIEGIPVTGSSWIRGAGSKVRLYWYNQSGTAIGSSTSDQSGTASWSRVSVTGFPPAGAAFVRIVGQNVTQATRPAITWTPNMRPWAVGEGCAKAVLHAASKSVVLAAPGTVYGSVSFTVTEVG